MNKKFLKIFYCFILLLILVTLAVFKFPEIGVKNYTNNEIVLLDDGAWCWYQDPRAVRYKNKTYIGSVRSNGDIVISSFDHNSNNVDSQILHSGLQVDDHAAPSILILSDGKIMIFYSAHVGNSMYYRTSINPEDISLWSDEMTISTNTDGEWGFTYPNPVQLTNENNKIYLFWRGGNFLPTFSTSNDGILWSPAKTLFSVSNQRPYMKIISDNISKIHFAFTDGHPNEVNDKNNIYYTYYQNGSFYKADGSFIKKIDDLPLLPSELDLVYDSSATGIKAWIWDISFDHMDHPVIAYAIFPEINDHRYRYAYWNGYSWNNNEITIAGSSIDEIREPYYSGGIAINHNNPSIVYLSKKINNIHEIERWTTPNNGFDWFSERTTMGSVKPNIRPLVPRGYESGENGVIWMYGDYIHFTEYSTQLRAKF